MNGRALITFSAILAATPVASAAERFEYEEPHMGTRFRIVVYAADRAAADKAAKAGFARVAELNGIMSDYLATSELSRLVQKNEKEPAGPVKVSEDLFVVLDRARQVSKLSGGAFDVTVRPYVVLWRHARRTQRLPDPKEMAAAKKVVGYEKLELDAKARTVAFKVAGVQLDLGGIAKGYAADEVLKVLAKHGIDNALVAAGGDVSVSGAPPGTDGWKVDIAPLPRSKEKRTLLLKDAAVSTSGDAEQFAVIDGVRYSHIVDPRTGIGLTGQRSVTVIARRGITADSMTKVASVLPAEKALAILEKTDGVLGALIVYKSAPDRPEETFRSKQFDKFLLTPATPAKE